MKISVHRRRGVPCRLSFDSPSLRQALRHTQDRARDRPERHQLSGRLAVEPFDKLRTALWGTVAGVQAPCAL